MRPPTGPRRWRSEHWKMRRSSSLCTGRHGGATPDRHSSRCCGDGQPTQDGAGSSRSGAAAISISNTVQVRIARRGYSWWPSPGAQRSMTQSLLLSLATNSGDPVASGWQQAAMPSQDRVHQVGEQGRNGLRQSGWALKLPCQRSHPCRLFSMRPGRPRSQEGHDSALGKMRTTRVRGPISSLRRFSPLVLLLCLWRARGLAEAGRR